jgi:hypothetical protein
VRMQIRALLLAGACCAAVPAMHAQKQSCNPPPADSKLKLTPEQQKASDQGYRLACESANAAKAKAAQRKAAESESHYQLDSPIVDIAVRPLPSPVTLRDYMNWLDRESAYCPDLTSQARTGVNDFTTEQAKLVFLKVIRSNAARLGCE